MIKVVHIVGSLGFGGVERVVTLLCDHLDHQIYEVHIISLSDHIPLAATIKNRERVKIHTCGRPSGLRDLSLHFPSTFRMYRILNEIKPHIIHSHLYYLNNLAYSVLKGIPHVITIHGPSIMAKRNRARQTLFAAVNLIRKNKATYTIVVSESVKQEIVQNFRSNYSSLEVIHNGIDTGYFNPEAVDLYGAKDTDAPKAINIARHVHRKGIECLLRAWKIVCEHYPEACLYLVGDGPQHYSYKQLALKLGLDKSISFTGARDDVRELMARCRFGIFPSETEGMPMAPAEMMAMKLPVVGSDIAPLKELINPPEGGDIFPVNDHEALARIILFYLEHDKEVKEKGEKARTRVVEEFSIRKQVEKHQQYYQKILSNA